MYGNSLVISIDERKRGSCSCILNEITHLRFLSKINPNHHCTKLSSCKLTRNGINKKASGCLMSSPICKLLANVLAVRSYPRRHVDELAISVVQSAVHWLRQNSGKILLHE